jgi:prepilin-type N-terminal cleavage/methylation domain-containing protein
LSTGSWWNGGASNDRRTRRAFTLIEFMLVMGLLAGVMALVAPRLSGFFRQRTLEQEARRFLALTEHGRNEAMNRGIPMVLWIDPGEQVYGLDVKVGYPVPAGKPVEFAPDGSLDEDSLPEVILEDRSGEALVIAQTTNGLGYEIMSEQDYAYRLLQSR